MVVRDAVVEVAHTELLDRSDDRFGVLEGGGDAADGGHQLAPLFRHVAVE